MTDYHNQSFFGQNSAFFVQSSSKYDDFIFIRCIKRKAGNVWEKPSQGEGKNIKLSLGEMIMIRKILTRERDSWSTYHRYNDDSTQISFNWQGEVLWANIGEYGKKLQSPNIEILDLLLQHLITEKIEYGTGGRPPMEREPSSDSSQLKDTPSNRPSAHTPDDIMTNFRSEDETGLSSPTAPTQQTGKRGYSESDHKIIVKEEVITPSSQSSTESSKTNEDRSQEPVDARTVKGTIRRETPKALLIMFENGVESWIPKSTIHSQFSSQNKGQQPFLIQSWVLDKNNAKT